jgi:hypothetical protein
LKAKARSPKIPEIAKLLMLAVEANERAEKAHLEIAALFRSAAPETLFDPIAEAVADLHEAEGERDYAGKAQTLIINIMGNAEARA